LRPRRAQQGQSLALAFEFLALMGSAAHLGMEVQALLVDIARGGVERAHALVRRQVPAVPYFLA
jgi:hypothetical protein